MARITTTPIAGAPRPYNPYDPPSWERKLAIEEHTLKKLKDKLSRATAPGKRHRYATRIKNCTARILALKLAHS